MIDGLVEVLDRHEHVIVVMTPDDRLTSRGVEHLAPRDNLIFELGLFIGRHGRRAAFILKPSGAETKLPSDLSGVVWADYDVDEAGQPELSSACAKIQSAIERHAARKPPSLDPSPFWDSIGDDIVILFGVEADRRGGPFGHPRMSLRDFGAADGLRSYLKERYPDKSIEVRPATDDVWHYLARSTADLVVVGGFVTNDAYVNHQREYESEFRLKMGRLCSVAEQRCYHVEFGNAPPGEHVPTASDPQRVETFPSAYASLDFGLISSDEIDVYGSVRRVVVVSGVKGHGTAGAAGFLTRSSGLDALLSTPLARGDRIRVVVESQVHRDQVFRTSATELVIDGDRQVLGAGSSSVACELGRSCDGCQFASEGARRHVRAIILDFDDTIVDTFTELVAPLERRAAEEMVLRGGLDDDPVEIAACALLLRRTSPDEVESLLQFSFKGLTDEVLAVRRAIFEKPDPSALRLSPEAEASLRGLSELYDLYLVSAGPPEFQQAKIQLVGVEPYFKELKVVESDSMEAKKEVFAEIAREHRYAPHEVLVVGNRVDREIEAAIELDMGTVWIKRGEGSDPIEFDSDRPPRHTLPSINELLGLLQPKLRGYAKKDSP